MKKILSIVGCILLFSVFAPLYIMGIEWMIGFTETRMYLIPLFIMVGTFLGVAFSTLMYWILAKSNIA